MKGISAYICIGRYAGFKIFLDGGVRIIFGWIGIALIFCDIERAMETLTDIIKNLENEKEPR